MDPNLLLTNLLERMTLLENQNAQQAALIAAGQVRPPAAKPPHPAHFTGSAAAGPRVTDFVYQTDLYFDACGISADQQRIAFAATLLRDHALSWWRSTEGKANQPSTWAGFKSAIKAYFQPAQVEQFARDKLSRLRQLKSVSTYTSLFRQLALDISDSTDSELAALYRRGLKSEVALQVSFANPATLEDSIHTALRIDEILHQAARVFPSGASADRPAPQRSYVAAAGAASSSAPMELGAVNAGTSNTQVRAFAARLVGVSRTASLGTGRVTAPHLGWETGAASWLPGTCWPCPMP